MIRARGQAKSSVRRVLPPQKSALAQSALEGVGAGVSLLAIMETDAVLRASHWLRETPIHGTSQTVMRRVQAASGREIACVILDTGSPHVRSEHLLAGIEDAGVLPWLWTRPTSSSLRFAVQTVCAMRWPVIGPVEPSEHVGPESLVLWWKPTTVTARLVPFLRNAILAAPAALGLSLLELCASPLCAQSPNELASRANLSRRSLDRWLRRLRVPPARRLIAARRVMASLADVIDPSTNLAAVARANGFDSVGVLRRSFMELLGVEPTSLQGATEVDSAVSSVLRKIESDWSRD